ncbi:MAG TPA: ParA family protein [Vicinamibacterales bacterium]|nr:ParA family protein [Vicinamibacterales bacterium]
MILAAFNPKGGVGKTTTAVNVAAALARMGRSVLLIDLEADLNASISLGVRPRHSSPSIADLLLHQARAEDAIRTIGSVPNLHLITGSFALTGIDAALRNVRQPERRLGDVVRPLARQFEFVILDSPAGYSLVPSSVPLFAQHLVVPIRAEYLSLESVAQFLRWYRDFRLARRTAARLAGILLTRVDHRRQATREIVDIIRLHSRQGVFRTEIPEDPRVAEAPSHGVPVVQYTRSRAAIAYERLAAEVLKRTARRPA